MERIEPMNAVRKKRHLLFHGELSDAPGRDESWDEYIRYLGGGKWELTIVGTNFDGISDAEPVKERMATKTLLSWVHERDEEIEDGAIGSVNDRLADDENGPGRTLSHRAERLREIAALEGASYCVSRLDAQLAGMLPRKQTNPIRILDIIGVSRRGVPINPRRAIYYAVYHVHTNLGSAFLYPPAADGTADLVLTWESTKRRVKIPEALLQKIQALKPEFDAMSASVGSQS